jgi:gluconolactonase
MVPPADNYSPGFSILEGPVWIDGALYLSQITSTTRPPPSRILKVVPGMAAVVFLDNAGTNGLAVDGAGQLFGAVHKDGSISRFDLANPSATPVAIASMYMGKRFNSPNDLAIRSDGNIYFSDPDYQSPQPDPQPTQQAYRISPTKVVTPIGPYTQMGSMHALQSPNGMMLSRDENSLYVGSTSGLFKYMLANDGTVGAGAPVAAVTQAVDGTTKDCAGNSYIVLSNAMGFVVLDKTDAMVGMINVGVQVTNLAFGGSDRQTLYITSLGSTPMLYEMKLNVPGYPY